MLPLPELQAGVRSAMLGAPPPRLLAEVEPDGLTAAQRLQIYANHVRISLVEALACTFPVVKRLVGEACFAQGARRFAMTRPPASPCLFEYGARFPVFLGREPVLRGLPYLPDVARLEWKLNEARHAPEAPASGGWTGAGWSSLETSRLVFAFDPATRLMASRFPVDQIWQANQPDVSADRPIVLEDRGVRLLIQRDADGDVGWFRLDRPDFAFVKALAAGLTLGRAVTLARSADPGFEPAPLLQALIGARVLIDAVLLLTSGKEPS